MYRMLHAEGIQGSVNELTDRLSTSMSFTDRLPLEMLSKIFLESLESNIAFLNRDFVPSKQELARPLILAAVCKGWREAALSTPQLWRHIHITGSNPSGQRIVQTATRAGSLPLYLSIYLRDSGIFSRYDIFNTDITRKIKGLDLSIGKAYSTRDHFREARKSRPPVSAAWLEGFPNLQRLFLGLSIRVDDPDSSGFWMHLTHIHVQIQGDGDTESKNVTGLRLPHLTSLIIESNNRIDIEIPTLLLNLPSLVELCAPIAGPDLWSDFSAPDEDHIHHTHHNLKRVCIDVLYGSSFFDVAILPSLRDLTVSAASPASIRNVIDLLERSKCCLRRLAIISSDFNVCHGDSDSDAIDMGDADSASYNWDTVWEEEEGDICFDKEGYDRACQRIEDEPKEYDVYYDGEDDHFNRYVPRDRSETFIDPDRFEYSEYHYGEKLVGLGRLMKQRFDIPIVEYSPSVSRTGLFEDIKARWYEHEGQ